MPKPLHFSGASLFNGDSSASFHVGEQQFQCADPVCKLVIVKGYTAPKYEIFEGELKDF